MLIMVPLKACLFIAREVIMMCSAGVDEIICIVGGGKGRVPLLL